MSKEFKNLISNQNGLLFQDNTIMVQYKSEFEGPVGRVAMQFQSKSEIQDLQIMINNDQGFVILKF